MRRQAVELWWNTRPVASAARRSGENGPLETWSSRPWSVHGAGSASVRFHTSVSGAGVRGSVHEAFGVATTETVTVLSTATAARGLKNSRRCWSPVWSLCMKMLFKAVAAVVTLPW